MVENGHDVAAPIPSYLIECLVWNVPDARFGGNEFRDDVRSAIAFLWKETLSDGACGDWGEINDLKYLFWAGQPWSREQINKFLYAAWNYIGFK